MLRVRNDELRLDRRPVQAEPSFASGMASGPSRASRLIAMAGVGLALGAGGAILAVSMVQAGDDAGVRAFHQQEAANRRATSQYASAPAATAYAPSRYSLSLPLFQTRGDGRIAHPPIGLNPFQPRDAGAAKVHRAKPANRKPTTSLVASSSARSICVRLCDGFHAPIGLIHSNSDMKAHEVLCRAMNPGVPVQVFKVAAGAGSRSTMRRRSRASVTAACLSPSGTRRRPTPACRPAIVQEGERRVSLLRDFTLRAGDSVVLNGKVKTFIGSSRWPYSASDFRDFRMTTELTKGQRKEIDERGPGSREGKPKRARCVGRCCYARRACGLTVSPPTRVPLRGSLGPVARGRSGSFRSRRKPLIGARRRCRLALRNLEFS